MYTCHQYRACLMLSKFHAREANVFLKLMDWLNCDKYNIHVYHYQMSHLLKDRQILETTVNRRRDCYDQPTFPRISTKRLRASKNPRRCIGTCDYRPFSGVPMVGIWYHTYKKSKSDLLAHREGRTRSLQIPALFIRVWRSIRLS